MNRDDLFYSSNRGKKMKKLIGTLAVLICFIFMLEGCGLKKVKSGAPEDYYMNDMVISPQQAEDNLGNSYYLFMESELLKGQGRLDDAIYFMKPYLISTFFLL